MPWSGSSTSVPTTVPPAQKPYIREKTGRFGNSFCISGICPGAASWYLPTDWIYTDGDFPFGWQCAAEAFDRLNSGADVVMGVRGADYGNALHSLRKLISKGVRRLNRFLLGMPERYLDTQAGMKAFRGAGKQAFLDTTVDTFLFDTEFILLAWDRGLRIDTIPLTLRPGLSFSKMGWRTLFREFGHFLRIMPAHWFRKKQHRPEQD